MQVTGNSRSQSTTNESILSIQLALNGLSFSILQPSGTISTAGHYACEEGEQLEELLARLRSSEEWMGVDATYKGVRIILDTPHYCLIPQELYEREQAKSYLALHGVTKGEDQKMIRIGEEAEVVALLLCPKSCYRLLIQYFGADPLCFTHPHLLALQVPCRQRTVEVMQGEAHTYLMLRSQQGALLAAEAVVGCGVESLLWGLQTISETHTLRRTRILLSGAQATSLKKGVERYYKEVTLLPTPTLEGELSELQHQLPLSNLMRAAR